MTIQIPKKNAGDYVLALFGKKRAVFIPDYKETGLGPLGPYVYMEARRESFLRALFRPAGAPLKDGWVDWEDIDEDKSVKTRKSML